MKKILRFAIVVILMFGGVFSVEAQKNNRTTTDIKLITTKQFYEPYDLVFKAMMSLMHSEEYIISDTDYLTGLILVNKDTYKGSKSFLNSGVILVDKLNEELTEVKLTMYSGESKTGAYGGVRRNESMEKDPEYYNNWFNNLYLEIQRRKALR